MSWLSEKHLFLQKKISEWSKWSFVRKLQNETLLKATYVWFVIVPVIARVLSELEETVTLTIGGKQFTFLLDLPFSWKLLYIASLLFIIANILYRVFAPAIIKENADFGDFSRAGKTELHIEEYMTKEFVSGFEKSWGDHFENQYGISGNYDLVSFGLDAESGFTGSTTSKEPKENVFWAVFTSRDKENMRGLNASLLCLAGSAVLSLVVSSQQVWHVFEFIWLHGLF